jgi:hypothetical protein
MGSYDGAEICELVGLFILDKFRAEFKNDNIGLYRDDGLAAFKNVGARTSANSIGKRFAKCFKADFQSSHEAPRSPLRVLASN